MEIKLTNKSPYWMYFRYITKLKGQRGVECIVKQDREELARTSVFCHHTDIFVKEKGRVKAIEKIVEILGLTKDEKREFFNQYFNRSKSVEVIVNITKVKNTTEFFKGLTNLLSKYES